MTLESCLKKSFEKLASDATFNVYDIKTKAFRCSKPLIQQHEGETTCHHRLILLSTEKEGFLCGLESYEYVLTTEKEGEKEEEEKQHIVYISKIDTTTTKIKGLTGRLVQGYIASLPPSTAVFVFARAQPQYLFAKSAENKEKAVLDDRSLVSWWLFALNKLPMTTFSGGSGSGWWSVPGIDDAPSALIEIGARKRGWQSADTITWKYGHSFPPQAEARLVIPQFEDDAKSRFLKNMAEESTKVAEFWELLAFGEECGSGKVTGFFEFRLPKDSHSENQVGDQEKIESDHYVKNSDFTLLWNKLMALDFSSQENTVRSSAAAKKDIKDLFPDLKPIELTTTTHAAVETTTTNKENSNADKRPAIHMLSSGLIKRKKV